MWVILSLPWPCAGIPRYNRTQAILPMVFVSLKDTKLGMDYAI